jgi:hypothetical protein
MENFGHGEWYCLTLFIPDKFSQSAFGKTVKSNARSTNLSFCFISCLLECRSSLVQCAMGISLTKIYNLKGKTKDI